MPVFETVELGDGAIFEGAVDPVDRALETVEPALEPVPPGGDEIDEDGEIFDAIPVLLIQRGLHLLEPADRLPGEAAHLGDVPPDREHFGAHAVLDGRADPLGDCRLELGGALGQGGKRLACPLDRGVEGDRIAPLPGSLNAAESALDRLRSHVREASVRAGR